MCALAFEFKQAFLFPRRFRLTRREGFSRILRQPCSRNQWFAIHTKINKVGCARLGVSISKRIIPSSVRRNSTKRLIRECFRLHARQWPAYDVVVKLLKPFTKKDRSVAQCVLRESLNLALAS